jgi:hypothetical protein
MSSLLKMVRIAVWLAGSALALSMLGRLELLYGPGLWLTTLIYLAVVFALLFWGTRHGIPFPATRDSQSWEGQSRIAAFIVGAVLGLGALVRLLGVGDGYHWPRTFLLLAAGAVIYGFIRRRPRATDRV